MIILKISKIPFQIYRISHLISLNTPHTVVPKALLHKTTPTYLRCHSSDMHQIFQMKATQEVIETVHLILE